MKYFFLVVLCAFCFSACRYGVSEPYPAFVQSTTSADRLPALVRKAFVSLHPDAIIEDVETSSFKGKIQKYRISFRTSATTEAQDVFTSDGERVFSLGSFPP